jgi:P4 family phage/plasmid primase-like protien
VLFRSIPKGDCPWQLYGSKKKNRPEYSKNEVYELTSIYNWNYDMETDDVNQIEIPIQEFNLQQNFKKMSARYEHHPPFYSNDFYENEIKDFYKPPENRVVKSVVDNDEKEKEKEKEKTTGRILSKTVSDINPEHILGLSSINDLDQYIVDYFIDNPSIDVDIKQIIEYTLILPEKYWDNGSYELWIRVGWALYGVSNGLFGVWVKFSSQWGGFMWKDVYDLYDKWKNFKPDGLSRRSIIYWAKNDAYEKYIEIKTRYNKGYVEDILARFDSVNDIDFAQMAHKINKDRFVCASPKYKFWYEFKDHRWILSENGSSLTKFIFDDLRILFQNKTHQVQQLLNSLPKPQKGDDDDDAEKQIKYLKLQIKNLNIIVKKLGNANDINRIVNLCAIEYYDKEFIGVLDENRDLLCFKNGVVDLTGKVFRDGLPQDYISKCTNINYIKYEDIPKENIDTINLFMDQLFPDKELCTYMWEHLASSISGRIHNQTFNYYIGLGSNGKSVLTDLMKECLGDYNCASQISLITEEAPKHGSADSYLAELKGARFVIMQEPSKGKTLKEGLMKQLTSGIDEIKTRALFKDPISYKPHLTLVVCANQYLKIDSQDEGTWRRIRAIPFLSKFCANPDSANPYEFMVDIDMPNKLKLLADCFLSMLVNKYFQTQGVVNECSIVTNKSKEYRINEDLISQFIDEMIYLVPSSDADNVQILKQSDVIHYFKLFKEMHGDTRKYINKEIFAIINKKYASNVEYIGKNGKTLQWRNLMIIDND